MNEPESIKVVLVGESGVGKTSIISQFTSKKFDAHRETSLSAQFISKTVEFKDIGKQIKFDIWVLPVVKLLSALWVHLFFIGVLIIMCILYKVPLTVYLLQVLYYSFGAAVLGLGFSYLFSSFTVFFKDMTSIVNIIVQIGFWVTPIIWNEKTIIDPTVRTVLRWNPAHYFTNGYRECLIDHRWFWENLTETIFFWSTVLIILFLGIIIFRRFSPYFADEI